MAYEPYTWKTGEVITAEKLNNMESGIGSCVFWITEIRQDESSLITLDKTGGEILDAMKAGKLCIVRSMYETEESVGSISCDGVAAVHYGPSGIIIITEGSINYNCVTLDDYPVTDAGVDIPIK